MSEASGPRPIFEHMKEIVPLDVVIEDANTADGKRVNRMHVALYGRNSASWDDQWKSVSGS